MPSQSLAAAALIGCDVFDTEGRRLGRTIAVIHKAAGVDVLVEGRHWWRRRSYRFRLADVSPIAGGCLLASPRESAGRVRVEEDTGRRRVEGR